MTRDELIQALQRSSLSQGAAAANALRHGWTMAVHQFETPYEQLASVYEIRSERLRRRPSPHAQQLADDRFDYSEQRFVTLGLLEELVVSIVHTEMPRLIRIISFRKATKHEQAIFFKNL